MADINPFRVIEHAAPQDRWTTVHVYGSAGGVQVVRALKEGQSGTVYLLGLCSAAADCEILAEAPDTPGSAERVDAVGFPAA